MKVCVLIPSAEDAAQAGVRIRYRRIEPALKSEGHALQVTPIQDVIEPEEGASDAYIISKCYDARAFVVAGALRRRGKLVGVDLFDDYFSQVRDSRFSGLRYWLDTLSRCTDFLLCSTPEMHALVRGLAPEAVVHLMNDPAARLDTEQIRRALRHKLEETRSTGVLNVAWFGIGDNPHFPVGLRDLVAFGAELTRLQQPGLAVRLGILTNRRAMTADALAGLGRLAVPHAVEEWTAMREERLLAHSLVCFLPVNAQNFSTAKSLNRAVSALCAGAQVLSSGYPLYDSLSPFIYRTAAELLSDFGHGRLALREETVPDLMRLLEQHADPAAEARGLVEFLEKRLEHKREAASAAQQPERMAVVHGARTTDAVHKFAQGMAALSVCSPYCKADLNFDLRFALSAAGEGLDVLVAERHCAALPPPIRKRLKRHGKIIDTVYRKLEYADLPSPGGTALARMGTAMSIAAGHGQLMASIEQILGELFPGIRCYRSEHGDFPWQGTARRAAAASAAA